MDKFIKETFLISALAIISYLFFILFGALWSVVTDFVINFWNEFGTWLMISVFIIFWLIFMYNTIYPEQKKLDKKILKEKKKNFKETGLKVTDKERFERVKKQNKIAQDTGPTYFDVAISEHFQILKRGEKLSEWLKEQEKNRKERERKLEDIEREKWLKGPRIFKVNQKFQENINSTKNACPNCGRLDGKHDPKCYI